MSPSSVYSDESLNRMAELNCVIYGAVGINLDIQPSKILTPTKPDELQKKISLEYDKSAKLLREEHGLNRISDVFKNIAKYFISHEKVQRPYLEVFYLLSIILFPKFQRKLSQEEAKARLVLLNEELGKRDYMKSGLSDLLPKLDIPSETKGYYTGGFIKIFSKANEDTNKTVGS